MTDTPNKALSDLLDRQLETSEQLRKLTLELKELVSVADLLGMPVREVRGKVGWSLRQTGHNTFRPWNSYTVVVRVDGQDLLSMPLVEAPGHMWPTDVRRAYDRYVQTKSRRKAP